jgi:hypothetical protein
MPVAGAHTVGAADGGAGLPGVGWSREHGDLRIPHFVGLHAIQALPLIALAIGRLTSVERRRVRLVLVGAGSYVGLFAILLWQALRGQPLIAPDATTVVVFVSWLVATGAAAVPALRAPGLTGRWTAATA